MSINLIIDMGSLGNSGATMDFKKRVKVEGGVVFSWVVPLYGTPLEIIFYKKNHVFLTEIEEKYGLCNKRLSPNSLKIRRDLEEKEVEQLFGLSLSRNKYRYSYSNDEQLIAHVERLWMIAH
jgi:hypothetical protein